MKRVESSNTKGKMKDKPHAVVGGAKSSKGKVKWKVLLQIQKLTRRKKRSVNLLENDQEIESLF